MLTQVITATFSLFVDDPVHDIVVVMPRAEELPEVASASRNHAGETEPIETRLFSWMDH